MNRDIQLITLVERFPHLYDKTNKKYKDRMAIENSWPFISGEIQIPSTCTDDVPSTEESLQSLSDILSENTLAFVRQQTKSKALNTSTLQKPITSNTSTQRLISLNPSTQRPISSNSSTPERPITPNTSTPERPITPNTCTPERPITPNTSILKRSSQKRKQPSDIEEHLGNAVDIFKSFVTRKNIISTEDESLKYFCDSLYGDLTNLDKKDLISCKIEIMQIISRYTK
ncbi:hypothetical protein ACS0PU_006525 [Formica fusca]